MSSFSSHQHTVNGTLHITLDSLDETTRASVQQLINASTSIPSAGKAHEISNQRWVERFNHLFAIEMEYCAQRIRETINNGNTYCVVACGDTSSVDLNIELRKKCVQVLRDKGYDVEIDCTQAGRYVFKISW